MKDFFILNVLAAALDSFYSLCRLIKPNLRRVQGGLAMVSRGFKAPTDGCIYKTFGYKNKFNLIKKWGKFKSGRAIRIRILVI